MSTPPDTAPLLTVKEVAVYLKVKERTVYDLVRQGRIPGSRVTGKWLFPMRALEEWVQSGMRGEPTPAASLPPVVAGSHDPLLEWALRESSCGLALLPGGSLDGLRRFAAGGAQVCGLHLLDEASGTYNLPALQALDAAALRDVVLLRWAHRIQGLLVAPGNPKGIQGLQGLVNSTVRIAAREQEAGTHRLFHHLLREEGVDPMLLNWNARPCRTHGELGLAILEGEADAGLGVQSAAHQLGLGFLPLHRERFDLAVHRRDFFQPAFQALLHFTQSEAFATKVASMTGYDVEGLGQVVWNGP